MEPNRSPGSSRSTARGSTRPIRPRRKRAKTMGSSSSNGRAAPAPPPPPAAAPAPPHPLHVMDADEEDENVKQLSECAALYLSLQAPILSRSLSPLPPSPACSLPRLDLSWELEEAKALPVLLPRANLFPDLTVSDLAVRLDPLQDCLVESNRNWKACQKRKHRDKFVIPFSLSIVGLGVHIGELNELLIACSDWNWICCQMVWN